MTTLQNNIIYKAVLFCVCFAAAAAPPFAGAGACCVSVCASAIAGIPIRCDAISLRKMEKIKRAKLKTLLCQRVFFYVFMQWQR